MSVKKKVTSILDRIALGDEGLSDDPELFYINERAKSGERVHFRVLEKMRAFKSTFDRICKDIPLPDYATFREAARNPAGFVKKWITEKNVEQRKPVTVALLDEGYELDLLAEKVRLPDGFDEVWAAAKALTNEDPSWDHYTYDGEEFRLTGKQAQRLLNRIYYHAAPGLPQKRLELARKFLKLIDEWGELLRQEAEAKGIHSSKIDKAIESKSFIGPLPYCLTKEISGSFFSVDSVDLRVNEDWVTKGHAIYADRIGLSGLAPSHTPRKYEDPNTYRRYWRTSGDGGRRPYYVVAGEEARAYSGTGRDANVKFDDGEFILRDGKFIEKERKTK